jgi:hypothetical protein
MTNTSTLGELVRMKSGILVSPQEAPKSAAPAPTSSTDAPALSASAASYVQGLRGVVRSQKANRILVVGLMPSNIGEWAQHPQVEVWSSQEEYWTRSSIPANVGAVLLSRFISHSASGRIMSEAKARQIICTAGVLQTGEIRKLLDEAFKGIGPQVAQPEPEATQPRRERVVVAVAPKPMAPPVVAVKRGRPTAKSPGITAAVERHLDLHASPKLEGDRIYPLIQAAFPNATRENVQHVIQNIRSTRGAPKLRGNRHRLGAPTAPTTTPQPPAAAPLAQSKAVDAPPPVVSPPSAPSAPRARRWSRRAASWASRSCARSRTPSWRASPTSRRSSAAGNPNNEVFPNGRRSNANQEKRGRAFVPRRRRSPIVDGRSSRLVR